MKICNSPIAVKVFNLIEDSILFLGYRIVKINVISRRGFSIQLMIEKSDFAPIKLEDCSDVVKHVTFLLDDKAVFSSDYSLEVGSCGLNRPLTRPEDFSRFLNSKINLKINNVLVDQKKYKGIIGSITDDGFYLIVDNIPENMFVKFDEVEDASLIYEFPK